MPTPRSARRRRLAGLAARAGAAAVCVALATGCVAESAAPARSSATTVVLGTREPPATVPPSLPFNTDGVPTMKVAVVEDGDHARFEAPDAVQAGTIAIDLENRGEQPHDLVLLQARPNITPAQVGELLAGPTPEAVTAIAVASGGSAPVPGKATQSVAVRVEPGEYYLASLQRDLDGRVGASQGLVKKLTVGPADDAVTRRAKPPEDAATVTLADDSIKLPGGFGLPNWFGVTNTGQQTHELVIVKLKDGAKPEDAKAWLTTADTGAPGGAPPFTYAGGSAPLDPGKSDSVKVDLGRGSFVAFCRLPDRAAGYKPHYDEGVFLAFNRV